MTRKKDHNPNHDLTGKTCKGGTGMKYLQRHWAVRVY